MGPHTIQSLAKPLLSWLVASSPKARGQFLFFGKGCSRAQQSTAEPLSSKPARGVPLSSDLDDPEAFLPYFLWDDPMNNRELRRFLRTASLPERTRLLAKILREARDTDVWRFTTPESVAENWSALSLHLGRRRAFWEFLLSSWARQGRIDFEPAR